MQVPTSLLLSCKWRLLLSRGKNILPQRAGGTAGQEAGPVCWAPQSLAGGWRGEPGGGQGHAGLFLMHEARPLCGHWVCHSVPQTYTRTRT